MRMKSLASIAAVAVAAGILGFGPYHGGDIESCMRFLDQGLSMVRSGWTWPNAAQKLVDDWAQSSTAPPPGFGHRLHTQDPLMRQLAKIKSVVAKNFPPSATDPAPRGAPHETLLVLDATSGQNALRQAEEFAKAADVSGIFLAKLDGTAKGGIVIAIRSVTNIPVKFVGVGETPDDIEPFDPEAFVDALFSTETAEK